MTCEWREPACTSEPWTSNGADPLDGVGCQWFAVQVRTGREQTCATHLLARGYDVFLPMYQERRRWSDRIKKVERALFAGYLFCRLAPIVLAKIVTTPGVIRIVGNHGEPLPVSDDEIDAVRRIVETQLVAEPWSHLQTGDRVRVESGPLRGVEGVVLTIRSRHRLIVSVSLLQRAVAVEIDPEWVSVSRRSWEYGTPLPIG